MKTFPDFSELIKEIYVMGGNYNGAYYYYYQHSLIQKSKNTIRLITTSAVLTLLNALNPDLLGSKSAAHLCFKLFHLLLSLTSADKQILSLM